ncbi:MAG: hypothetical protein ABFS46_12090 [Myxococcota bacterium]
MNLDLDEAALLRELTPALDAPRFRQGITTLSNDPFFVAYFLVSVSQGEALGEKAVALIGQEEIARLLEGLERQQREECSHKERTLDVALELFPESFDGGRYRYGDALGGQPYYLSVLEANRRRLKDLGRYSRLALYLTTTFGYEIMVMLLYRAVADAMERSQLAGPVREKVGAVLRSILEEEATHLGVIDQHNALLAASRQGLSAEAGTLLDSLACLEAADYRQPAQDSVAQVVRTMEDYAEPVRHRAAIEAGAVARE